MSENIFVNTFGWIINHQACIDQHYDMDTKDCNGMSTKCESYKCPEAMFDIKNQYMMDTQFEKNSKRLETSESITSDAVKDRKKRKRKLPQNSGEKAALEFHLEVIGILHKALEQLVSVGLKAGILDQRPKHVQDNNVNARQFSIEKGPGDTLVNLTNQASAMGVAGAEAVIITDRDPERCLVNVMVHCDNVRAISLQAFGSHYIIPPKCSFLMSDFASIQPLLSEEKKYNVIVIDPPWQNKSIKRKRLYNTIMDEELLTLPLQSLCAEQCLVVVWVTNKQRQHRFVVEELFPKMKVQYKANWYWLKVTRYGDPVLPLDGGHKKPYECLILGSMGDLIDIPANKVLVTVPCALHSRKPPLEEVLVPLVKSCLKSDLHCLEMFARNLTPGWTSWGNEVLKHQHSDYFHLDIT